MPDTLWNRGTLETRIADSRARRRHPGGSPDETEIAAYAAGLPNESHRGYALVLGMTPELRRLALSRFARVVSVDSNPHAISLYRDWINAADRTREDIVEADWLRLPAVAQSVSAVLADGAFGNLPDLATHARLLSTIAAVLAPTGRFVARMALIPDNFDPSDHRADCLLARFRSGELDEAEFGFGMRLVGHYETCYDERTYLLDNAKIFTLCEARHAVGELSDSEHAAIRRYYFGGFNCILPQREWERVLADAGWDFQIHRCRGKAWSQYYPVYSCWPNSRR